MADTRPSSELASRLDGWIDEHAAELLEFAAALVRIPTENRPPVGAELGGQRFLRRAFERLGAEVDFYFLDEVEGLTTHPAFFPGRNYEGRPNVIGAFRGRGGGRSLLFSSHMDTAERGPLPWPTSAPFSGEVREGKLWGRGSFDMKGGLTASLYAALAARAVAGELSGDVLIESVVDEEWAGANGSLAGRLRGHNADAAILPEPTALAVYSEHMGCQIYRLTIPGSAGMVFGNAQLQNPVETAYLFVEALRRFDLEAGRPPLFEGVTLPPPTVMAIEADAYGVPRECTLKFVLPCYKEATAHEIHARAQAMVRDAFAAIEFGGSAPVLEPLHRFLPGSAVPPDHPILDTLRGAYATTSTPCVIQGAPLQCDAFIYNLYSPTPAVILGPIGANAHTADEWVSVDSLLELTRIYARTIVDWCA